MTGALAAIEFDFRYAIEGIPQILGGLPITILLTVVVMGASLPFAIVLAGARLSRFGVARAIAYLYTELFRTTPILVWVFLLFFALPVQFRLNLDPFWVAVLALSLNISAFLGEIFRGALTSVDPGQREAAVSSGMTERQSFRRIVLPQAFLRSVPLLAAVWISLFKDVSLAALIGVHEMIYEARFIAFETFRSIEVFTVVSVLYLLLTYPQALLVNRLFEKYRVRE
ncbi:MAG: amino acid ABC transporter permease [Chloroflexi bacterium]|nr:amino acid ABC transporter permease [Chloroflexota bacterium]